MTQINKYSDRAAYSADTERLTTKSAVSLVRNQSTTVCDGVNVVVDKPAVAVGDLAMFNKTAGTIRFIKGATLVKEQIPANLIPVAVVYARLGHRVLVVSLDFAQPASNRWAHSYEVALSGFDLAAGGTFVLRINSLEFPFTYAAGATLADIASAVNAAPTLKITYGWTAAVDEAGQRIILSANTWSRGYATIDVVSGCTITRTPEDRNYQTTNALIEGSYEQVRRKNGVDISWAGCNSELFLQHCTPKAGELKAQKPGSGNVVRESVFTEADNPELVAAYPTYRNYLLAEHLLQYPCVFGAMLRNGKANTERIGRLRFTDIHGNEAPCYPAAAAALEYGVEGLEAGAWWLPSVEELYLLMHDRALAAADRESDPVNRTLTRLGRTPCYALRNYPWTCCEYDHSGAFLYNGDNGYVFSYYKYINYNVRPVSTL